MPDRLRAARAGGRLPLPGLRAHANHTLPYYAGAPEATSLRVASPEKNKKGRPNWPNTYRSGAPHLLQCGYQRQHPAKIVSFALPLVKVG